MNNKKKTIRIVIVCIVLMIILGIYVRSYNEKEPVLKVVTWDDLYNGDYIDFYYSNKDDDEIMKFSQLYGIEDKFKNDKDTKTKVCNTIKWLRDTIGLDNGIRIKSTSGYDILDEVSENRKVSSLGFSIIERDMLTSLGIRARVGELRGKPKYGTSMNYCYIVEYYDEELNKWIAVDVAGGDFFKKGDKLLSGIEIIKEQAFKTEKIEGFNYNSTKNINDFTYSYSVYLDNTTEYENSNCMLTYVKKGGKPEINDYYNYYEPQIFTENSELFEQYNNKENRKKDDKPYIVIMGANSPENDIDSDKVSPVLVIGAAQNSRMINSYYLKINDKDIVSVKDYYNYPLKEGVNKISLITDPNGKNTICDIEVKYNKK